MKVQKKIQEVTGNQNISLQDINNSKISLIINYGNKEIPAYLTTPPFNTAVFEGREIALQEVHDKLFGGNNLLMLVNGQGGIGKTTFAAKYWLKYQDK